MVHLETLNMLNVHLKKNYMNYVQEHPGEWVFLKTEREIKVLFFKSESDLDIALAPYKGRCGPTYIAQKLPLKTHKYKEGNLTHVYLGKPTEFCPNDGETKLEVYCALINPKYKQVFVDPPFGALKKFIGIKVEKLERILIESAKIEAECPDCGCVVNMPLSEEEKKRTNARRIKEEPVRCK